MKIKKLFRLGTLLAIMGAFSVLSLGAFFAPKTANAEDLIHSASEAETSEITSENEVKSTETEEKTETVLPGIENEQETEGTEEVGKVEHTVASRVEEWFSDYFLEFIASVDLAAVAGCIVAVIFERKSNKKNTVETNTTIKENTAEMKRNTKSNDEVLRATNQLIDGMNTLTASDEKRDVDMEQLLLFNKTVMEILVTVYVNNKNIPQATKDLVNLKYVNALKGGVSQKPDEVKEVSEE